MVPAAGAGGKDELRPATREPCRVLRCARIPERSTLFPGSARARNGRRKVVLAMSRSLPLAAVLLASLAVVTVPTAHAQSPPVQSHHLISLGLGGGVSVPVGDAKDAFKNGVNGQGFARLNLGWFPLAPRIDVTFQKFNHISSTTSGTTVIPSGTSSVLAGVANFQMPLFRGPVTPYIVAGLGAYNLKSEPDSTGAVSSSQTHFGINGGAGLLIKLGIVSLYGEGRVDNVYTDKGVIDTKAIRVVPVTIGLVY